MSHIRYLKTFIKPQKFQTSQFNVKFCIINKNVFPAEKPHVSIAG